MPLVSVVIPAYNAAPFIAQAIGSALAQADAGAPLAVEVIVVDDGSVDGTAQVVQGFGSRVRYLRQENAGVSSARNAGYRLSHGDFLCFLDADDVLAQGWFTRALQAFEGQPGVGVVFGQYHHWYPPPGADPATEWDALACSGRLGDQGVNNAFSGWIYHQMLLDSWILCGAALVRRNVVRQAGLFEEGVHVGEDWAFWLRVSTLCPVVKVQRIVTLYRQHPQSATRRLWERNRAVQLIQHAIAVHGWAAPPGAAAAQPRKVHAVMAKHHAWHAVDHFDRGDYGIALASIWHSLRLEPAQFKRWLLLVAAALGLGRWYVRCVVHRRR